jgi:glycosyltransferase involved in cell wall biosynthesis
LKAGGPEFIIEDGVSGLLVDKNDPEAFARVMTPFIENEAFVRQVVINAARVVRERYSAPVVAEHYGALLSGYSANN